MKERKNQSKDAQSTGHYFTTVYNDNLWQDKHKELWRREVDTWYNRLDAVENHGDAKKICKVRDSLLHVLAVGEDDWKVVFGY